MIIEIRGFQFSGNDYQGYPLSYRKVDDGEDLSSSYWAGYGCVYESNLATACRNTGVALIEGLNILLSGKDLETIVYSQLNGVWL